MQKVKELKIHGLEFRVAFYLILKLTLTPVFSHLFSVWILNRFFVGKIFWYFLVQLAGLFIYEFTVWDRNNVSSSFSVYASVLGGFKLIIPEIYTANFSVTSIKDADPYIYQWLPHFLVFFSSIFNSLIPVLTKSY